VRWDKAIGDAGFAILPALFSHEYLDQLLHDIDESGTRRSRAGIRHALSLSPVTAVAREPQMIELAREVLGSEAFPFRATLFDKSPTANWLVVWHQDTALPLRERIDQPGWGPWSIKEGIDYAHAPATALSQVLALRVLPATHTLGVLTDDSIHELAAQIAPVDCVVPKGGVVAMRPLVVHASSKSQIEMPRRVLHIEYAASESIVRPLQLAVA
jgi:hypothetical protein